MQPCTNGNDLQTQQETISEFCAQQEEKPRLLLLRDKTDGSRKLRVVMPVIIPSAVMFAKRQIPVKPQKNVPVKGITPNNGNTVAVGSAIGKRLLADIIAVFKVNRCTDLRSKQLLAELCADPKKPWATFCKRQNLHSHRLSALLKEFGIHSKDIRFGSQSFKGYLKEWFVDAAAKISAKARK